MEDSSEMYTTNQEQVRMDCAASTDTDIDYVLLQLILQHQHSISVRQLFRLRCVSKLWHAMLIPPNIFKILFNTPACGQGLVNEEYWFIMAAPLPLLNIYQTKDEYIKWDFMAFSTADNKFFRPPPLILSHFDHGATANSNVNDCNSFLPRMSNHHRYQPYMLSSYGLMSALLKKPRSVHEYQVMVFNCITRSVKLLPPPLNPTHLFHLRRGNYLRACNFYMSTRVQQLCPSRHQLLYYIMLTNLDYIGYVFPPAFEDEEPYIEVYDSSSRNWKVASQFRSLLLESSSERDDQQLTLVLECDFFFMYSAVHINAVLGYHVAKDMWVKVNLELNDSYTTLVKCNGRLFGCCCLQLQDLSSGGEAAATASQNQFWGFVVNELQFIPGSSTTAKWVEVARTPEHLQQRLSFHDWNAIIRAEGRLIYMVYHAARKSASGNLSLPPLVYDIDGNNWYNLPSSDISTHFGCVSVLRPWMSLSLPDSDNQYWH